MADTKLSDLIELAATPANDDEVYIRDVSEAEAAESKRISVANLAATADGKISTHANLSVAGTHGSAVAATVNKLVHRDAAGRSKFAAPAAAGEALIKGTRVTTAELPALIDEKIWVGTGGNVEERDVPISRKVIASDLLINSNNAEKGTTSTSYTKLKEVRLDDAFGNRIRVKFDLKWATAGAGAHGRIYRNGVAIGIAQSAADTWVTKSEDLDSSSWISGDLIQIYVYSENDSYTASVKNMRFCYSPSIPVTNQDPA